MQEVGELVFWV